MNFILYGKEEFLINKQINKLISNFFKDEEKNIIKLNYLEDGFNKFLDELAQTGLSFFSKKIVLFYDSDFLSVDKENKKLVQKDVDEFLSFLKNKVEDVMVVLITNNDRLLTKSKIAKYFEENEKIYPFKQVNKATFIDYIAKFFAAKKYSISLEAINLLYEYVNNDLFTFENEANKLMLFKMENHEINVEDIKKISAKTIDDNFFELSDAILKNNKKLIFDAYNNLKVKNVEPVRLINALTTNFIFYDQILFLKSLKKSDDEIANTLNVNPFRVTISLRNLIGFNNKIVQTILDKLYSLDKSIKTSEVDRFFAFEMFLLNI